MTVLSFSAALRERTWSGHGDSEGAEFMTDLMKGRGTRDDYVALVAQHYFVYQALEAAAAKFAGDPKVEPFLSPALTRMPALEADLEFLLGADWLEQIAPLPTAVRYVDRIDEVAADGRGAICSRQSSPSRNSRSVSRAGMRVRAGLRNGSTSESPSNTTAAASSA